MKFKVWFFVFALVFATDTAMAAQEQVDPVDEIASRIWQEYPDLDTLKARFENQAKWEERTEPNRHEPEFNVIIRRMESPGIEIYTLEAPQHDRFFITEIIVKSSGIKDFLGIDIGSSRDDVIGTFGNPHQIEGNRLGYYDQISGYTNIIFVIENGRVIEMRYIGDVG